MSSSIARAASARPELIQDTIPLLDEDAVSRGRAQRARTARRRAAVQRECHYLLCARPRCITVADRRDLSRKRPVRALPMEEKLAVEVNEDDVGYLPMKGGPFPGRPPSRNAAFFLRRDRKPDDPMVLARAPFPWAQPWPGLPGFRETALAYMLAMETLCRRLVPIYAAALNLPPDAFDRAYAEPHLILRLTHYPPLDRGEAASLSLTPHTDSGFMTLFAPNPVPGRRAACPTGAGSTHPPRRRVRGERGRHPAPLDRRALPLHAAPGDQPHERRSLRHPVLLRPEPRHARRVSAELPLGGEPAGIPPIAFGDYAIWFARKSYKWRETRA